VKHSTPSLNLLFGCIAFAQPSISQTCLTNSSLSIGDGAGGCSQGASFDTAVGANALFNSNAEESYDTGIGGLALQFNTTGTYNTASGYAALNMNTTGNYNTAVGASALQSNTSGITNTAVGAGALSSNTVGNDNTAVGTSALLNSTTGAGNTSSGYFALAENTTGSGNTASGFQTMQYNTTGDNNTAMGMWALQVNTTGAYNTAVGYEAFNGNISGSYTTAVGAYALSLNTTGGYDTAFGAYSLPANTSGTGNTAFGYASLRSTTAGNNNIGFGYQALYFDSNGSDNIAMGYQAGYYVTSGSNNIEIGNTGQSADENVIRIGSPSAQTATFVAGISDSKITGAAVYVTAAGQLGVLASSERYKTAVAPIGPKTAKLQRLRPVSFHLKNDPNGAEQYGLIAEEVEKIYPELVIRDQRGAIQGVRYDELAPMLLNEMQRQQKKLAAQEMEIGHMKKLLAEIETGLRTIRFNGLVARR
jgi:hypothetical protein